MRNISAYKRIAALFLSAALLLFSACAVRPPKTGGSELPAAVITGGDIPELNTGEEQVPISRTVAYIPLDDRPSNYACMSYRARALGYGIMMPDEDLFMNRLSGQPGNSAGTLYGQCGKLFTWLCEQEEKGCDYYIISLDMLLSGGLVNSRSLARSPEFRFDEAFFDTDSGRKFLSAEGEGNGGCYTDLNILDFLFVLLGGDENNRVWLLDSVMRLAPTVGYPSDGGHVWTLDEYNSLRSYFSVPRPELSGDALTVPNITDGYGSGADGQSLDRSDFGVEDALADACEAARARKLFISYSLFVNASLMDPHGVFNILYGIDDSANENCVQTNEIALIREMLRPGDALLSGVDDMGYKAVARMFLDDTGWEDTAVSVNYYGGAEDEPVSGFDYKSLDETLREDLDFFRLKDVSSSAEDGPDREAAFNIYILTHPGADIKENAEAKAQVVRDLLDELKKSLEADIPSVLIDASNQSYDGFPQCLPAELPQLGKLLAYSGRLDLANLLGTSLSYAASRYAFLCRGASSELTDEANMRVLADVLISDICYRNSLRYSIDDYVKNTLGGDYNNFCVPQIDEDRATSYAASRMEQLYVPLMDGLNDGEFISSLEPLELKQWKSFKLSAFRFPWHRSFECSFGIVFEE